MQSSHAPTGPNPAPQVGNPPLLHRFLGAGLLLVSSALIIARHSGVLDDGGESLRLPAFAMSGVSFLMCAAALLFLKSQVPARKVGQTPAAYWSDATVAPKALIFWFILEGSGVLAAVSYFLGGGPYAAVMIAATVTAFWMNGPSVFEAR